MSTYEDLPGQQAPDHLYEGQDWDNRARDQEHDRQAAWLAVGLAAVAAAGVFAYQVSGRNRVAHHPPDDAPDRTARRGLMDMVRSGAVVGRTVTINRPKSELYAFWRDFKNLPKFMQNVKSVSVAGDLTRWQIAGPAGQDVTLETRITEDRKGEVIAWESTEASDVRTSGRVMFRDAPAGRGTEVEALISYVSPGGEIGRWIAKLFQAEPALQGRRELKRFKMLMETGEVSTNRNRTFHD